jgi:plastocyanin
LNRSLAYRCFAAAAVVLCLLSCSKPQNPAAGATKSATQTVDIDGTSFRPATLIVNVGDTVMWVNKDPFPHTVTSDTGSFDSKELEPGASWTYTAVTRGDFAYFCKFHPNMKGTLRVR